MEMVYNKFKGRVVTFPDGISGIICGYVEDNLLLALTEKPIYSFRQFSKGFHFVADEYKGKEYRYCYCGEKEAEKSI